ncbi:putative 60S ribosomal protein L32' [Molossus molossus]|uniref:putative 60S ribosomal protein L32' n=1 Tax=Molossus molossus TaxID=27622 RepID=UPI001746DA6A|nr:putative 60S ribosomal protein L32' [Molossus molossus]
MPAEKRFEVRHTILRVRAALGPLARPKISTKSKKFIWHQSDRHVKIKRKLGGIDDGGAEGSRPDLDAQHRPWQQQEHKAHAAQWLLEVAGPQGQAALGAAVMQRILGAEMVHDVSSQDREATGKELAIRVTNPKARLHSEEHEQTACVHIVLVLLKP